MKQSTSNLKNPLFNDMKFNNPRVSIKNKLPINNVPPNIGMPNNNDRGGIQQLNGTSSSTSNYHLMVNNTNNNNPILNQNLSSVNFKDYTYNEEFYTTLSKNTPLPILEHTGASKLLNQIYQNRSAPISSTTGQYIVCEL